VSITGKIAPQKLTMDIASGERRGGWDLITIESLRDFKRIQASKSPRRICQPTCCIVSDRLLVDSQPLGSEIYYYYGEQPQMRNSINVSILFVA